MPIDIVPPDISCVKEGAVAIRPRKRGTKSDPSFQIGIVIFRKGANMKPPLLIALLVIGMLAGLALIFTVI